MSKFQFIVIINYVLTQQTCVMYIRKCSFIVYSIIILFFLPEFFFKNPIKIFFIFFFSKSFFVSIFISPISQVLQEEYKEKSARFFFHFLKKKKIVFFVTQLIPTSMSMWLAQLKLIVVLNSHPCVNTSGSKIQTFLSFM